jgi:hypothetical protein
MTFLSSGVLAGRSDAANGTTGRFDGHPPQRMIRCGSRKPQSVPGTGRGPASTRTAVHNRISPSAPPGYPTSPRALDVLQELMPTDTDDADQLQAWRLVRAREGTPE